MIKFLKFLIVGISNVVPGLCSATMSIILNIYDDLLGILSNIFNIKYLMKNIVNIIGILVGVLVGIFVIKYLFNMIPFILNIIFLGFVIRSFPIKLNNNFNKSKINFIYFIIGLLIVLGLSLLNKSFVNIDYSNNDISTFFLIIINGIFVSLAMILPGISGALLLVVLGLYFPLIDGIISIVKGVLQFKFEYFCNFNLVIIFSLSFLVSLIFFSKVIKKLLNSNKINISPLINGMILGSIINIILNLIMFDYVLIERVIGIVIFIIIIFFKNKFIAF